MICCSTSVSLTPWLSGPTREAYPPSASFLNELTFFTLSVYFLALETVLCFDLCKKDVFSREVAGLSLFPVKWPTAGHVEKMLASFSSSQYQ